MANQRPFCERSTPQAVNVLAAQYIFPSKVTFGMQAGDAENLQRRLRGRMSQLALRPFSCLYSGYLE